MRKVYVTVISIVGSEPVKDYFTGTEDSLRLIIGKIEEHKEIYERVIIYEEATGDAVYFYNGKKK